MLKVKIISKIFHYGNNLNYIQYSCFPTCFTCNGGTKQNCTSCDDTLYYFNSQCYLSCPSIGSFLDKENNICVACHLTCLKCFGPNENNCSACLENTYLNQIEMTCGTTYGNSPPIYYYANMEN